MNYNPTHLSRWTRPQCYMGATWEGYFVAPVTRNRDSDCLTNSNWDCQWRDLSACKSDVPYTDESSPVVVSEKHWAVGWVEWVAIHESNEAALRVADRLAERLESYPVLDEEDWSQKEQEEAEQVWRNCYRQRERIAYIREHRSQFEFSSLSDLLACVRGKYFAGYASELLA